MSFVQTFFSHYESKCVEFPATKKETKHNECAKKKLHSVNVKSRNGGAYILQLAFHPKAILIQSKHRREVNAHA